MRKALICNAATNVVAPFLGVAGVTFGVSSVAATKDNAKSGIAPIVASIGFVISLFVMAVPALFATVTYPVTGMNVWNYFAYGNGGIVYLIQGVVFTVVDIVMVCVGFSMAASLKKLGRNWAEWIPAIITVAVAVLTTNLVAGAVCGAVVHLIISLIRNRRAINIPMIVVTVLLALVVILL